MPLKASTTFNINTTPYYIVNHSGKPSKRARLRVSKILIHCFPLGNIPLV